MSLLVHISGGALLSVCLFCGYFPVVVDMVTLACHQTLYFL